MRKLFVSNFISLDGYIAGPGEDLSWHTINDEFLEYCEEMLDSVDTILFGRLTYEMMFAYWPLGTSKTNAPLIAGKMNGLPKIVLSKTLNSVEWENSTLFNDDIETRVKELKAQRGKDIVVLGSASIVSAFTQMGLNDEYRMFINPVILGAGKPEFTGHIDKKWLKLTGVREFSSGLIMLTYQPK